VETAAAKGSDEVNAKAASPAPAEAPKPSLTGAQESKARRAAAAIDLEDTLPATSPRSAEVPIHRAKSPERDKSGEAPASQQLAEKAPKNMSAAKESLRREPALQRRPAPPTARKKSTKLRNAGIDALAELEKIRQQTLRKKPEKLSANKANGNGEISQSLKLRLSRQDLARATRFSLTLQLEDRDLNILDEVHRLHVKIDDAASLESLLLRLNIDLDARS
jgi:hypothetical protein